MYFKSVALVQKGVNSFKIIRLYNRVLFSFNILITKNKIYKGQCFLVSTFSEEYFLIVYLLIETIPKKVAAILKFVEKKNLIFFPFFKPNT